MSDSPSPENEKVPGDPVVETDGTTAGDSLADVAARAQAGIADAEAARASSDAPAAQVPVDDERIFEASTTTIAPAAAPVASPSVVSEQSMEQRFADERAAADRAADAAAVAAADEPRDVVTPAAEPTVVEAAEDSARAHAAAVAAAMADDDDTPWYDRPDVIAAAASVPETTSIAPTTSLAAPAPVVAEQADVIAPAPPAVVAEQPTVVAPVLPVAQAQPIFVQAPEPPRKRGNRGFSGVVALVATLIFAVGVFAAFAAVRGFEIGFPALFQAEALTETSLAIVSTFTFWTPVVAFFLSFWLLGAFINTAKWAYWVIFGLFVGLISFVAVGAGAVLQRNPMTVAPTEALDVATVAMLSLPGITAMVLGRELPVWLGGWVARRGRRVIAANIEAQEDYERTLEAGPQLTTP